MALDQDKMMAFIGLVAGDLGGATALPMAILGDELGFYKALQKHGPLTSNELAKRTGTVERNVREWLHHQVASGYLEHIPGDNGSAKKGGVKSAATNGKFALSAEHAMVLAMDDSPAFLIGAFNLAAAMLDNMNAVKAAFKSGKGAGWTGSCATCATERLFRARYLNMVNQVWLPALDGVIDRLTAGATVADVGCGHGLSTILMARAFPNSTFLGIDFDATSIKHARKHAKEHGAGKNLRFDVATSKDFKGSGYDLICLFDCLHDMGDPVGAVKYMKRALKKDGVMMVVEPFAEDKLIDNLTQRARLAYAASTLACVPVSQMQETGLALGAQAGGALMTRVLNAGGFSRVRRAYVDPNHLVLEARR